MPTHIALVRDVNVGGRTMVANCMKKIDSLYYNPEAKEFAIDTAAPSMERV